MKAWVHREGIRQLTPSRKILLILNILTLAFIWLYSVMPPSLSSQESSWVTIHIIQPILDLLSAMSK